MTGRVVPAPRSWLFVPGDRPDRFAKALASGADAVILDLEDAVPPGRKGHAIQEVARLLENCRVPMPTSLWVRTDDPWRRHPDVVALSRFEPLTGYVVPKLESVEQAAGWHKPVLGLVETPKGVVRLPEICAQQDTGLFGLALGPEDLCAALGVHPTPAALGYAAAGLVMHARSAGLACYACPGSIGDIRDEVSWCATLAAGKALGSDGSLCIHPSQLAHVHRVFAPSSAEIAWARAVVGALAAAGDEGATSVDGRMIDRPVVERALRLLDRANPSH